MKISFDNIENIYSLLSSDDWIKDGVTLKDAGITLDEARILLLNTHLLYDKDYNERSGDKLRELLESNFDTLNFPELIGREAIYFNEELTGSSIVNKALYDQVLPYCTIISKMLGLNASSIAAKLSTYFSNIDDAKNYLKEVNYLTAETVMWSFLGINNPDSSNKNYPTIALSYNKKVRGHNTDLIIKTLASLTDGGDNNLLLIDYRDIIPLGIVDSQMQEALSRGKAQAERLLDNVDGLIIPGNSKAVYPSLFGSDENFGETDKERLLAEFVLIHVALQKGMPIMAVCGGHELFNVYHGGSLANVHSGDLDYKNVAVVENSELARIISAKPILTQSFYATHKQIVSTMGGSAPLNAVAYARLKATKSEYLVATESKYGAPIKTFQFHPENPYEQTEEEVARNSSIFKEFVTSCKSYGHKQDMLRELSNNKLSNTENKDGSLTNEPDSNKEFSKGLNNLKNILKEISKNQTNKYSTFKALLKANSNCIEHADDEAPVNSDHLDITGTCLF